MIRVPLERYNPEQHAVQTNVATSSQFIAEGNSDPYSRPGYGGNWFVRDPIHNWLVERQIDYKFDFNHDNKLWYIGFEDANDATIFKLSWTLCL